MAKLSLSYIEQHKNSSNSYDAFGRLIFETILEQAENIIGSGTADSVSLSLDFELSPVTEKDCLKVCVYKPNGEKWCFKQFENEVFQEP